MGPPRPRSIGSGSKAMIKTYTYACDKCTLLQQCCPTVVGAVDSCDKNGGGWGASNIQQGDHIHGRPPTAVSSVVTFTHTSLQHLVGAAAHVPGLLVHSTRPVTPSGSTTRAYHTPHTKINSLRLSFVPSVPERERERERGAEPPRRV